MRHAIHPEADAEFAQAVRYYADIDPQLGLRFYNEIERVITAVCDQPDRCHRSTLVEEAVRRMPGLTYLDLTQAEHVQATLF